MICREEWLLLQRNECIDVEHRDNKTTTNQEEICEIGCILLLFFSIFTERRRETKENSLILVKRPTGRRKNEKIHHRKQQEEKALVGKSQRGFGQKQLERVLFFALQLMFKPEFVVVLTSRMGKFIVFQLVVI